MRRLMQERPGCVWTAIIVAVGVAASILFPAQMWTAADGMRRAADRVDAAVDALAPTATAAAVPVEAVDGAGRAYRAEGAGGLVFGQVTSMADGDGRLRVVGELHNAGQEEARLVIVLATLYGADGLLRDTASGVVDLTVLAPGGTSPFDVRTEVAADDVGRYVLRVNP